METKAKETEAMAREGVQGPGSRGLNTETDTDRGRKGDKGWRERGDTKAER